MSETNFKKNAYDWERLKRLVHDILQLLENEGFEKRTYGACWEVEQYKEDFIKRNASEETISGEMFWFYKKTSTEWPQEKDINRNGYCLFLRPDGKFQFQLRCFCNNGGAIISKDMPIYSQCMKEFRDKCELAWHGHVECANIENQRGGLKIIICEFNADSDSMEEFVKEMVDWDKNYIDEFNRYRIETIKKGENLGDKKMNDPEKLLENMDNNDEKIKEEVKKLLSKNPNIILNGAPGTGKTYLARDIAIDFIFENEDDRKLIRKKEDEIQAEEKEAYRELRNKLDEQYCFVQFHQSYDYTDFVEGLRPKDDGKGNIGFERKDGVFKDFCKKAIGARPSDFDSVYTQFIADVKAAKEIKLQTPVKKNDFTIAIGNNGGLKAVPKSGKEIPVPREELKKYYETGEKPKIRESKIPPIAKYLKDEYSSGEMIIDSNQKEKDYIFVIDEINRGEMSKIFGELFFSIDPGYRGTEGRIKTQYQNLINDDNDVFVDGFFVPDNVYIIGTMNDIDRSVESMDFAMRRRFAFKEITADDRKGMLNQLGDKQKDAENVMTALNEAIEKIDGLSSAYHIGPAYFLKLKNYEGDDIFDKLWKNHIAGVIKEYLRGIDDKKETKFNSIKDAYYNAVNIGNAAEQPLPQDEIPNA